ncbi:MAG: sialidase family protein [Phycisphaerales bacterium]
MKFSLVFLLVVFISVNALFAAEPFCESKALFKRLATEDHFRSPHIYQKPDGTIIATATLKIGHMRDTGGIEKATCKYSIDDGITWHDANECSGVSVIDKQTGTFWSISKHWPMNNDQNLPMTEDWMINNHQKGIELGAWAKISSSKDNGKTWQATDVTKQCFTYPNTGLAWFIGRGIQLQKGKHAGRLIIPGRYFGKKWDRVGPSCHNTLIYSDDHGKTWQWGGSSQGCCGEGCVVELSDGSVYLNNRNHDPNTQGYRSYSISKDGGKTFTDFGVDCNLPEPKCHASIVRYNFPDGNTPGRVLFLNPAVSMKGKGIAPNEGRKNLTVKLSYDDCKTWPIVKTLRSGKGGYSDMIVTQKGTVLCVFESGEEGYAEDITLVRFNIDWLEDKGSN